MPLTSAYDGEWVVTVTNSSASAATLRETKGAFLGNGKVGYTTAFHKLGVQKSIVGVDFDYNESGMYKTNVIEGFDPTTLQFFDNRSAGTTVQQATLGTQVLHMDTGIATSTFSVTDGTSTFSVATDMYAVRHLPYCTVQTVTITPAQSTATLDLYHIVAAGQNVQNVEYNNNVVFSENLSETQGVYMLTGRGTIAGTNHILAASTAYILETPAKMATVGFNVYASDVNSCFQKIRLTTLVSGTPYKLHFVTAQMSDYDFKQPQDETRRILVNVLDGLDTPSAPVTRIRAAHVKAWLDAWKHNVLVEPKLGITQGEADAITELKRVVRYNTYNLWSSVRDGAGVEVNPSSLSLLDTNGNLFWDGDLWFVPLLTIFKPTAAKTILETRYKNIERAMRLAAGYGYEGTKFPYANDVVGYGNNPYWDISGPLHIFNTALLSVSVWNYYRVTQDKAWLQNKGYGILKGNADFFASKIEIDEDGSYNIRDVFSINNVRSDNNALTNYLVKVALKYAVEASYELAMPVASAWTLGYYNLDARYFVSPVDVLKQDGDVTTNTMYDLLEQLVVITPFYFEVFMRQNVNRDKDTIERNLTFVESRINAGFADHPINTMLLTWLKAYIMGFDSAYATTFETALQDVLSTNVVGVWGNFNGSNSTTDYNDLSLSALFLLMLVTGPGSLRIRGTVSETRFYAEALGVRVAPSHAMPATWKNVRLSGVGKNKATFNVLNELYYNP